jgi:hypothetical protein
MKYAVDDHEEALLRLRLQQTARQLQLHGFNAEIYESGAEVLAALKEKMPRGASVAVGGSMTLEEIGVLAWLTGNPDYTFFDRYHTEDRAGVFHQSFQADYYLMSSNAVTLQGSLYNVDGNGNRLACLLYGPAHVIVIAGVNKIVTDEEAAHRRVEEIAAPANNIRLAKDNPCTQAGICVHCNTDTTICNDEVLVRRSSPAGRITVMLVNEKLGY